jgi:hypothetical protein
MNAVKQPFNHRVHKVHWGLMNAVKQHSTTGFTGYTGFDERGQTAFNHRVHNVHRVGEGGSKVDNN